MCIYIYIYVYIPKRTKVTVTCTLDSKRDITVLDPEIHIHVAS